MYTYISYIICILIICPITYSESGRKRIFTSGDILFEAGQYGTPLRITFHIRRTSIHPLRLKQNMKDLVGATYVFTF